MLTHLKTNSTPPAHHGYLGLSGVSALAIGHTMGIEFDRHYHSDTDMAITTCETDNDTHMAVWIYIEPIQK